MAVLTRLGTPFCSFVDEWTDMMVGQPDSSVELWDIRTRNRDKGSYITM
jgi:hypothetical protein